MTHDMSDSTIQKTTKIIDFMRFRSLALIASGVLLLFCIVLLFVRGLSFGIDFTGGAVIEVGYTAPQSLPDIHTQLIQAGFSDAEVVHFGTTKDVLIRLLLSDEKENVAALGDTVVGVLREHDADVQIRRIEFVGPKVGEELIEDGTLATLFVLLAILVYVGFRFQYRFSIGAVVALVHDVLITLGLFSMFAWEFDLNVLAALLAIIGYSLNDTIVVFDRIRENFIRLRKSDTTVVINHSLSQMLMRTIMTSVTTLLVVIALFIFGGEIIHNFARALMIGVIVGTYSSIYIAGSLLVSLGVTREHLLPPKDEEEDDTP